MRYTSCTRYPRVPASVLGDAMSKGSSDAQQEFVPRESRSRGACLHVASITALMVRSHKAWSGAQWARFHKPSRRGLIIYMTPTTPSTVCKHGISRSACHFLKRDYVQDPEARCIRRSLQHLTRLQDSTVSTSLCGLVTASRPAARPRITESYALRALLAEQAPAITGRRREPFGGARQTVPE